ncbi:unnamed protein product [Meganyctiphanes norvegica]|uniref:Uncharacterized protein n=1 Tax=Meganyctiphanes norvegica TaxID=48144 RepID=A0AAV2RPV0_MEGNR
MLPVLEIGKLAIKPHLQKIPFFGIMKGSRESSGSPFILSNQHTVRVDGYGRRYIYPSFVYSQESEMSFMIPPTVYTVHYNQWSSLDYHFLKFMLFGNSYFKKIIHPKDYLATIPH